MTKALLRLYLRKTLILFNRLVYRRFYYRRQFDGDIVEQFHRFYYDSYVWQDATCWLGIATEKCPTDLWVYQEIIYQTKPSVIIECGTAQGGSALFLASMCDLMNSGKVLTIDIKDEVGRPRHPRIEYLIGSSTSREIVRRIEESLDGKDKVMVILDSNHTKEHVLNELRTYSRFVTKGNYLIVEDTNVNGHPVFPEHGPGPLEAVSEFLKETKDFVADRDREKFFLTFSPNGYLRKR